MAENKQIPAIRFAGFTEAWEQRKLGNLNVYFTDGNYGESYPKASDMREKGQGVPFLTGGNLKEGVLDVSEVNYISQEKHNLLTSGHLVEDDIIIAVRGSLGALGYVNKANVGWNINSQLAILRTDKNILKGKYLIQFLMSGMGQNELLKRQTGSALKQLPIGSLKTIDVPITKLKEQEQISNVLFTIDNLITLHQRKYDKLVNIKKALLEKMFPQNGSDVPEIRFKGFTEAWEQRKLSELGSTFTGLSGKTKEDFGHGNAKFITYMNVFTNPIASETMLESVEIDKTQHEVKYGDVLFTTSSETPEEVGMSSIWLKNSENIYLNSFCFGYRPHVEIDPYYFAYVLRSNWVRKQIVLLAQGISRFNISKTKMIDIKVMLPSLAEQRLIGEKFVELDKLITLHQRKCEKLKNIKKSLLEKMFV